jgi:hypothetical protein
MTFHSMENVNAINTSLKMQTLILMLDSLSTQALQASLLIQKTFHLSLKMQCIRKQSLGTTL